jgi:arylsulfatase A-like enzyme
MRRHTFTSFVILAWAALLAISSPAVENERPNIILLLTDDQSYNSLGYAGNTQVKTPSLDRLASEGLIFDGAYDTTSICMASRAQVMTGMYEYKTGCNFSHGPLRRDKWQQSYPVVLRKAGYFTGFVGKFGFAVKGEDGDSNYHHNEDIPMDSFDYWCGWPGQGSYKTKENEFFLEYAKKYPHVTQAVGAASQDFIKAAKRDKRPFCLSVSFKAPHGPMSPDPAFDEVYADTAWETPPNYDQLGAAHIPEQAKSGRQYLTINDFEPDNYQKTMRKYQQLVYGIDVAVGKLREELVRQGVADNTVILFLTDNGYNCGSHGFGGKVLPYEEGSRSPMVIYDPRHPVSGKGKRCKAVVGNIDMAPTILDLAGLTVPENMDGKSLRPLLDNPAGRVRESMLLINAWGNPPTHELTVVTEDYKYIHWPYAHVMEPKEELYHLAADRYEMNNLVAHSDHRAALETMQQYYDRALITWKDECVQGGNYPLFAKIFDRHLSWDDKLAAMDNRMRRKYLEWNAGDEKPTNDKKSKRERKPKKGEKE